MSIKKLVNILLLLLLLLLCSGPAFGQVAGTGAASSAGASSASAGPAPILEGWGRWSAKVNVVDLLCTVPNVGVEFDFGVDKYSKQSVSLTARCNWNEWHSYKPYRVLNVLEFRPEYRQYKRGLERTKGVFYWGVYGSAGKYSFKFSETGHQGFMCGAGASVGTVMPLHEYKKFAIDVELGGSVGVCLRNGNAYQRSSDWLTYVEVPSESVAFGIVPFPIVSELRVAFVFRKVSVRERYHLTSDETTALRRKSIDKKERKQ